MSIEINNNPIKSFSSKNDDFTKVPHGKGVPQGGVLASPQVISFILQGGSSPTSSQGSVAPAASQGSTSLTFEQMQTIVSGFDNKLLGLTNKVTVLEQETASKDKELKEVSNKVNNLSKEILKSKSENAQLETDKADLKAKNVQLETDKNTLKIEKDNLEKRVVTLVNRSFFDTVVARAASAGRIVYTFYEGCAANVKKWTS